MGLICGGEIADINFFVKAERDWILQEEVQKNETRSPGVVKDIEDCG